MIDLPLPELRRVLHRAAERSGEERETAKILRDALGPLAPDALVEGCGGHGLIAAFDGAAPGPTVLLRADMDALPLPDDPTLDYASVNPSTAHLCGHDGHMALLVGVARTLAPARPARGRVVLVFQPAEETGAGARAVLDDPRFAPFAPDVAIAQHNLPGYPLGSVVIRSGPFASASRGMIVRLEGASAHAAEPHAGKTPVPAVAQLAESLARLPQDATALHESAKVTVVGVEAGGPAFGTSPASGRVMATLRAHEPAVMQRIVDRALALARGLAAAHGLDVDVEWVEDFPATVNDPALTDVVAAAADALAMPVVRREHPFAWSEDFGHFTAAHPGVLFGLGSGEAQPALHAPGYDFPDALIEPGHRLLAEITRRVLDDSPS